MDTKYYHSTKCYTVTVSWRIVCMVWVAVVLYCADYWVALFAGKVL